MQNDRHWGQQTSKQCYKNTERCWMLLLPLTDHSQTSRHSLHLRNFKSWRQSGSGARNSSQFVKGAYVRSGLQTGNRYQFLHLVSVKTHKLRDYCNWASKQATNLDWNHLTHQQGLLAVWALALSCIKCLHIFSPSGCLSKNCMGININ